MIWKRKFAVNGTGTTIAKRPKPLDVGHSSRKLLWFFGIYPGKVIERHRFQTLSRLMVGVILTSVPLLLFLRLLSNNHASETMATLYAFVYVLVKAFMYSYATRIADVESFLESEIFTSRTVAQDRFILRAMKFTQIYADLLRILSCLSWIYYAIFIPADVESIPTWVPIKPSPTILHIFEVAACVISLPIYTAIEINVAALITNASVQFQTLNDNLKNSCERDPEDCYATQESKIRDRLINYMNKLEKTLAAMLLWQVSSSVIGLCLAGFEFLLVPLQSCHILMPFISAIALLGQIFWYCLYADDIIVQSSEISTSCFEADWYVCSTSTKKMLLLIMIRAKEPVALEVKPFFRLSLSTFVMIVQKAYSYYAVLCTMYNK